MIARAFALGAALALMAFAPAMGLQVSGNTIVFTPEEAAACREEGGCGVWSARAIEELMQQQQALGRAACLAPRT